MLLPCFIIYALHLSHVAAQLCGFTNTQLTHNTSGVEKGVKTTVSCHLNNLLWRNLTHLDDILWRPPPFPTHTHSCMHESMHMHSEKGCITILRLLHVILALTPSLPHQNQQDYRHPSSNMLQQYHKIAWEPFVKISFALFLFLHNFTSLLPIVTASGGCLAVSSSS